MRASPPKIDRGDIPRVAFAGAKEAHRLVIAAGDELLAGGRVVDVHDGGHVVLKDVKGARELAHVENVDIVVLASGGEVEGLHRVPADLVSAQGRDEPGQRGAAAQVVQDQRTVAAGAGQHRCLAHVEAHGGDRVGAPLQCSHGLLALPVPDLDRGPGRGEGVVRAVVADGIERVRAEPGGSGRAAAGRAAAGRAGAASRMGRRVPQLDGAVAGARQQPPVAADRGEAQAAHDAVVRAHAELLGAVGQVPQLDLAVARARGDAIQRAQVFCEAVDTVHVAAAQLPHEWFGEHALHLGRRQRPRVFARLLKRVQFRV